MPHSGAILFRLGLCEPSTLLSTDSKGKLLKPVPSDREHAGDALGKVIEFYVPTIIHKPLKGALHEQCVKVIEFCTQPRKSA
jgi:hypothetical protein